MYITNFWNGCGLFIPGKLQLPNFECFKIVFYVFLFSVIVFAQSGTNIKFISDSRKKFLFLYEQDLLMFFFTPKTKSISFAILALSMTQQLPRQLLEYSESYRIQITVINKHQIQRLYNFSSATEEHEEHLFTLFQCINSPPHFAEDETLKYHTGIQSKQNKMNLIIPWPTWPFQKNTKYCFKINVHFYPSRTVLCSHLFLAILSFSSRDLGQKKHTLHKFTLEKDKRKYNKTKAVSLLLPTIH